MSIEAKNQPEPIDPYQKLMEAVSAGEESIPPIDKERIDRARSRLTPQEQEIHNLRFGFTDGTPHSTESTARLLNLQRLRVRRIERVGLQKLRYLLTREDPTST